MSGEKKTCKIRKNLQEQELGVPVGTLTCYRFGKELEYKWVKSNFYIFYHRRWRKANSIDFDFS